MSQSVVRLPAHVMRSVMQELKELSTHPLEGVKVIPNEKDVTEITAVIEGPADTPFAGGSFMIKLKLGPDFPASPPKGFFVTNIFHPNIRPGTGEICVNTLKKDWKETLGFKHTIKCLLIEPNPDSSLNAEAGRLFQESYTEYHKHASHLTQIHAIKENKDKSKEKEANADDTSESKENTPNNIAETTTTKKPAVAADTKKKVAAKPKRGTKRL